MYRWYLSRCQFRLWMQRLPGRFLPGQLCCYWMHNVRGWSVLHRKRRHLHKLPSWSIPRIHWSRQLWHLRSRNILLWLWQYRLHSSSRWGFSERRWLWRFQHLPCRFFLPSWLPESHSLPRRLLLSTRIRLSHHNSCWFLEWSERRFCNSVCYWEIQCCRSFLVHPVSGRNFPELQWWNRLPSMQSRHRDCRERNRSVHRLSCRDLLAIRHHVQRMLCRLLRCGKREQCMHSVSGWLSPEYAGVRRMQHMRSGFSLWSRHGM
jgi:hypothetical protein